MANRMMTADEATKMESLKPETYSFLASDVVNATTDFVSVGLPLTLESNKTYYIEMFLRIRPGNSDTSNNYKLIFQTTANTMGGKPLLVEATVFDIGSALPVFIGVEDTVMVGVDDDESKQYIPTTILGNFQVSFVKISGIYTSLGDTITTKFCAVSTGVNKNITVLAGSFARITKLN